MTRQNCEEYAPLAEVDLSQPYIGPHNLGDFPGPPNECGRAGRIFRAIVFVVDLPPTGHH
jgi:hypothetical protein